MNAQNKKQIIFASVLGLALIGVLVYQFLFAGVNPPPATPKEPAASSTTTLANTVPATPSPAAAAGLTRLKVDDIDLDVLLENIEVVTFDYKDRRIDRNPMAPLIGYIRAGDTKPILETPIVADVLRKKVTGIIWDQYDPVAVVDNELVALGHTYANGVQVLAIERDRVIFKVGDSLYPVAMKEL